MQEIDPVLVEDAAQADHTVARIGGDVLIADLRQRQRVHGFLSEPHCRRRPRAVNGAALLRPVRNAIASSDRCAWCTSTRLAARADRPEVPYPAPRIWGCRSQKSCDGSSPRMPRAVRW